MSEISAGERSEDNGGQNQKVYADISAEKITVFQDVRYSMKWGRQERARKILVSTSAGTALRTTTKNFR